jgi:recombination protein RecT
MMSENQVAPRSRVASIADYFAHPANKAKMENALGRAIPTKNYVQAAMNAIRKDGRLQACEPASLFESLLDAAGLQLVVGSALGHAYLVAYGKQCTLIIGYRGLIELATRSGKVRNVEARTVHEDDDFTFRYGLSPVLDHSPCLATKKTKDNLKAVYATAELADGTKVFDVLLPHEIEEARARSQSGKKGNGPWGSDYLEMARKTAVRRLTKYLPLSADAQAAIREDEEREMGLSPREVEVESAADAINAELAAETQEVVEAETEMESEMTDEEADLQAARDAWANGGTN